MLGRRLVGLLAARGHEVRGLARSAEAEERVRRAGGIPVAADLFDKGSLARGAEGCEVLIHAATSIPQKRRPSLADFALNDRIRRTISEPKQILLVFDQDAWAKRLDYSHLPLDLSRGIYEATRAGIIHLAREHYERNGHLEFIHSETGLRTLKDEFDKVAAHNEEHLKQIEAALAQS